jgi:hypothetical protein
VSRRYTGCELRYVPETGDFYRVLTSGEIEPAPGYKNKHGYLVIRHEGKQMLAHRRAFYLMTGQCPKIIDHINRDPSDNRWVNLREATPTLNTHNQAARNSTGFKGVFRREGVRGDRYYASISFEKRPVTLGVYADPQTAARAYDAAARLIYGPQAVTNFAA